MNKQDLTLPYLKEIKYVLQMLMPKKQLFRIPPLGTLKKMQVNRMEVPAVNHAISICFVPPMCESLVKSRCMYNKLMISCDDTCGILLKGARIQMVSRG